MAAEVAVELLESMLLARHLDVAAHELRASGHGHYTICSAGHEGNAVLGRLTRPTDPALVHYRSAALQIERARHEPDEDAVLAIALSLVASADDPLCRGRHKAFGNRRLGIIPQTSTIASHLPRAVGLAFGLERGKRLAGAAVAAQDAIAVVSFGDATINHSTALGAFNAAGYTAHQGLGMPLLFVCEDNGLGISVRSPPGWVEARLRALPHVTYFGADGWDLFQTWTAATAAVAACRTARRPAVLHLRCERLLGHAGSDVDTTYRTPAEIEQAIARDPVTCAAVALVESGLISAERALALDLAAEARVRRAAEHAMTRPGLASRREVAAPLELPLDRELEDPSHSPLAPGEPLTLAQGINRALAEALQEDPGVLVFGEDVAKKGGVYGVTRGLLEKAGPARVFNTLLDEQTILGIGLGTGLLGFLPVPEIQYLAYVHNAEDQIRGEAATIRFFSSGAYDNPMIVRVAGLAYQKGFGGHFHNDNSLGALLDVPGLILAVPARGDDAVELYRAARALARSARRVVVMVEPIALYHTRDLHGDGDGGWLAAAPSGRAAFGRARVYDEAAADLTIATYGNGVLMALRVAERLKLTRGARARVLDLRWLAPLPVDDLLAHAEATGRLLFADECRQTGNVSAAVAAAVVESGRAIRFRRVAAADCFIPLGGAAELVLLSEAEIMDAAVELLTSR